MQLFAAVSCSDNSRDVYGPGTYTFQIQYDGLSREFIAYVPEKYNVDVPAAVVLMFHGGGGNATGIMNETGWDRLARQEGFIAVFPEGSRPDPDSPANFQDNPQTWNDGSGRINVGAIQRNVDDVGFVNALLDDLFTRFSVDEKCIYAAGFSNGAAMTFRLGRELSLRLSAIACVASTDWLDQPAVDNPVPLMYITGTADPLNPIGGGEVFIGETSYGIKPPVEESIQKWVQMLSCPSESQTICDSGVLLGTAWKPCAQDSEVDFYTVEGMGHWWPGYMPPDTYPVWLSNVFGDPCGEVSGTELIWEFFRNR